MANGNGMYKISIAVVVFIISVVGCGITIYSTFHVPLANAISKEASDRVSADARIEDKVDVKLEKVLLALDKTNNSMLENKERLIRIEYKIERSN